jgi:iron complex transport system substrate-binding protein
VLLPAVGALAQPTVASINLCTDQLLLSIAAPEQILSLSWLSADPEESMLAAAAGRYPLNYGTAEELLRIGAEVVIAGAETSPFTRQLR